VLFTSYVRRKQWEAKLNAAELLSLVVKGMGLDKKGAAKGRSKGRPAARKLSSEELLARMGG